MEWLAGSRGKLVDCIQAQIGVTYSKKEIKRWLDGNSCLVNGQMERFASATILPGDVIRLSMPARSQKKVDFTVVYEDEWVSIIEKPAGISVEKLPCSFPLIHRLDRDTSGLYVLPKSQEAYVTFRELFEERNVVKEYLAAVEGIPNTSSGIIDRPMVKTGQGEGMVFWGVATEGLSAITHWELVSRQSDWSVLRLRPETGRTHQLRVHLKAMGHPVLGDYQYNRQFRCRLRPKRYLLHASKLSFIHPCTGEAKEFISPFKELPCGC